jgi:hypothetical protein
VSNGTPSNKKNLPPNVEGVKSLKKQIAVRDAIIAEKDE